MRRTTCSACEYDDLQLILDLGMSPVADAYTDAPDETPQTYPLQIAVCTGCHLVQLLDVLPQDVLFGTGYSFYSSASAPLSAYHREYADDVLTRYGAQAKNLVVEIGCNDGDMLRHFDGISRMAIGVDPAGGPVNVALERGLGVINEPFTDDVAQRIIDGYGQASVIIANHVLAHVESVSEVMRGVKTLLVPNGVAFIEVQYLQDLLLNNAFDLVYHEHRNFFSLTTISSAARRWGLHVLDAELTNRQGGSLRVTLGHSAGRTSASALHIGASERWLSTGNAYGGLQGRAERMRDRLTDLLKQEIERCDSNGLHIIGYGAPAKATTLLNFCSIGGDMLDYVVDTTLAKQDRYIPGTSIKIIAPSPHLMMHDVGTALLCAWNYAEPIMRKHADFTNCGGRWIVPIPAPTIL